MFTSALGWIAVGVIAGFSASMLLDRRPLALLVDMGLALVSATAAGWLFAEFASRGTAGFNTPSVLMAAAGSVVVLLLWHAFRRSPHWAWE